MSECVITNLTLQEQNLEVMDCSNIIDVEGLGCYYESMTKANIIITFPKDKNIDISNFSKEDSNNFFEITS